MNNRVLPNLFAVVAMATVVAMFLIAVLTVVVSMVVVGFVKDFGIFPIVALAGNAGGEKKSGGGEEDEFHVRWM